MLASLLTALFFLRAVAVQEPAAPLPTVAEASDYQATSRYEEVVTFCNRLAEASDVVRLAEMGESFEGRSLPLIVLADPPIATAEEAAASGKLLTFAFANIHAGEVCGKEALLMLAREIAMAEDHPLLKDLIIVFAPILNADGNERMAPDNRPGQAGPNEMGIRPNAQGLNINRDFTKLETPEARAMVRFLSEWDPAVIIDLHTTNGSHHQYTLTYDAPRNPAADPAIIEFTRDRMLPEVGRRLEDAAGYMTTFYGNFNADHTRWETYPALPRFSTHYGGLRNRIAILSEAYSYASFRDRVLCTREFVRHNLEFAAENKDEILELLTKADDATTAAGKEPKENDWVAVWCEPKDFDEPVTIKGYVEEVREGRSVATDEKRDYEVAFDGQCRATHSVRRPFAYLLPAEFGPVVANLQRHGIEVEELREEIELDVEVYRVERFERAEAPFEKHHLTTLNVSTRTESRRVEAGTILVRTGQPLGSLVVYLLEPESEDGLCAWNFFDSAIAVNDLFPVMRLPSSASLLSTAVQPLAENREMNKPITFETLHGPPGERPNFSGSPISGLTWLDDGEHYFHRREGKMRKVNALTGRSEPYGPDTDKLAEALRQLPTIDDETAETLSGRRNLQLNPDRSGALFNHENDLYYAPFDEAAAVRLTNTPGKEELTGFSPDGEFVTFVRESNLYVVDVATQTERALTTDGADLIYNGKAGWVYMEEVFGWGHPRMYWWSPDSSRIAFLQFDETPVHRFTVIDQMPTRQDVEQTPYPKAGDPNPLVRLGVVTAAGGSVHWADLGGYLEGSFLITRVGWMPDSATGYFYVQDRAQRWLDFNTFGRSGGDPKTLFRETTGAWVSNPGEPEFLEDGSFLLFSERSGWKHLYHFESDGNLRRQVTDGEWEVRRVHRVDEEDGWIYFSGTRDSHIASNLYRVRLDGTGLERLTFASGSHSVDVSPKGNYFIDRWSDDGSPTKVVLRATDGEPLRMLDTNPVHAIEEYRWGEYSQVQIEMSDGFVVEASLLKPPDFDPAEKYPVWFTTYAGPHAPQIRNAWGGGRVRDQMLARMGIIVFRCDPRSASGKGAESTWTAYEQLGVQELEDIKEAIAWLTSHPYIDASRIGMSGHSYGGFMTAFAMTHSELFVGGIAGAPVTDWRNYDTIYTERYMNTPQENPEGYDATSVVKAAKDLHGRLLILHGIRDDNVHVQNSIQLIDALQQADKDFEVMIYPQSRHGLSGSHYQRLQVDFIRRVLELGGD